MRSFFCRLLMLSMLLILLDFAFSLHDRGQKNFFIFESFLRLTMPMGYCYIPGHCCIVLKPSFN